jgi:AcrR family transcriptional regulator
MTVTTSRGGRPRDASIDTRALAAALELLEKVGYSEMTMDAVAAAAGVDKPAIYRRWSSKEEVVIAALATRKPELTIPDSGDARADLVSFVRTLLREHLVAEARVSPRIFDEAVTRPELRRLLWQRLISPRRRLLQSIFERGIARGQIRGDLDLDLASDALRGAAVAAAHTAVLSESGLTDDLAERIVAVLWRGFAPPGEAG